MQVDGIINSMPLILSIETATRVCSVALHRNGELLGFQELFLEKSHSTHLTVMIEQLLSNCQVELGDLEAIAISKGPGSYTGLRIGVATAKGLCYALEIPLIGINTLIAMAHQLVEIPLGADYLCPMLDARRMEVYCTIVNKEFQVESETKAVVVNEESFQEWMQRGKLLFFGNGAGKCQELLKGSNCVFMMGHHPTATSMGQLAATEFENGAHEDLAYFEPYYLKEFMTTVPKEKTGLVK